MNIGIDISQIVYEGTGVARFTDGLVHAILEYDTRNQWVFFFSSFRKNLGESIEKKIITKGHKFIKLKIPPTLLSFLSNDLHSSFLSSKIYDLRSSIDWFISSDWTEPHFPKVKKATIVHDLVYLRYPETVNTKIRQTQKKRLQLVKKESQIIFADSEATKKDCSKLLHIEEERIIINYPGIEMTLPTAHQINQTLKKYNLEEKKFILTVGKLEPRKNLERLIQSFSLLKQNDIELVIAGPKGWGETSNIQHLTSHIKFLGYVPDQELYSLYSSCLFFIFPSIWEGFGYPIIEAMKCEAPIACSNTSSIKEIAGNAALLFDPFNNESIYQSINALIQDKKLRNYLVKKGNERSKQFTWKRYYNTLISPFYDNWRRR